MSQSAAATFHHLRGQQIGHHTNLTSSKLQSMSTFGLEAEAKTLA
jgi:hypothetical protein